MYWKNCTILVQSITHIHNRDMSQRPSTIKRIQLCPQVTTAIVMGQILITGCHYGPDYPIPQSQSSQTADTAQCSRLTDNRFVLEDDLGDFSHQPQDSYVQTPRWSLTSPLVVESLSQILMATKGLTSLSLQVGTDLLYINQGKHRFRQATDWLPDINDPAHSVGGSAADFDGDGDMVVSRDSI